MTNDIWKMRERERERQRRTDCALQRYKTGFSSAEEYSFLSILVAFVPIKSQLLVQRFEPRHQFKHGLVRVERTSCVYVWVCVCGRGERGRDIHRYSIYMHIGFSTHLRVVYNVLCTIKTRTQQRACNKKEGEERERQRRRKKENNISNGTKIEKLKKKGKEKKEEAKRKNTGFWGGVEEKITRAWKICSRQTRETDVGGLGQNRARVPSRIQGVLSYLDLSILLMLLLYHVVAKNVSL